MKRYLIISCKPHNDGRHSRVELYQTSSKAEADTATEIIMAERRLEATAYAWVVDTMHERVEQIPSPKDVIASGISELTDDLMDEEEYAQLPFDNVKAWKIVKTLLAKREEETTEEREKRLAMVVRPPKGRCVAA